MVLREVLGTKYLTDEYADDVEFLITESINAITKKQEYTKPIYATRVKDAINESARLGRIDIDLEDCRFTGKVWSKLVRLKRYKDITSLYDTGDEARNNYLQEFMGFEYEFAELRHIRGFGTKPIDLQSMANWVSDLKEDVVYEVYAEEYVNHPYLLLVINLSNPNIKMIADNESLLRYAKRKFGDYMLEECNRFYYIYGTHKELLEAEVHDGKVHVVNIGDYDKATFVRKFLCMPWFIGNQRVSLVSASGLLKQSIRNVLEDLGEYLKERPVTIETFFPLRKEDL